MSIRNILGKYSAISMILGFMSIFFLIILLLSITTFAGVVVFLFGILYILYFGFLQNDPNKVIFLFTIATLFFPQGKSYNSILFSYEVWNITPFLFVQIITAIPILLQIIRKTDLAALPTKSRTILNLLVFSLFLYMLLDIAYLCISLLAKQEFLGVIFAGYIELFSSVIFFYGCLVFIRTKKQLNILLYLMLIASIEMGVEAYLYGILELHLPRYENVINNEFENKFISLIYGDYAKLVYIQYAGIAIALYFYLIKKNIYYLLLLPLQILPLLLTYQRTPMIAVTIIFVLIYLIFNRKIIGKILLCGIVSLCVFFFQDIIIFIAAQGLIDLGQFKVNYFVIDQALGSGIDRVGLAFRGIEIFISNFPFGIGTNYTRFTDFMISKDVPSYFKTFLEQNIPDAKVYYQDITLNGIRTDTHNFLIFFLVQFGLLGLIIEAKFVHICYNTISRIKSSILKGTKRYSRYRLSIIALTFMAASFFSFFFQSAMPYTILFLFTFIMIFDNQVDFDQKSTLNFQS
ncbi:MAG: O-antigen ligase family protein [Sediminibacterium sp.]